ncbi:MAG: rhomboid family intramembrane serine protease [Deltaproteobacteria bacterium]|nr:rhomboid family intramembrane serine protease [Deltaproteobacteria bacterium]
MESFIRIIAWIILTLLLAVIPERLQSSRQRHRVTPVVIYTLILLNVIIYLFMLLATFLYDPTFYERVIQSWGCRPADILNPQTAGNMLEAIRRYATLITYQFLHGGFFHLLGNMIFLFIFGPGVEMGQNIRFRGRDRKAFNSQTPFAIFYLLSGIGSAFFHIAVFGFVDGAISHIVLVGASGAISGILGAYLLGLWKDYNRITVRVFYYLPVTISVNFYILYWILMQIALFVVTGDRGTVSYAGHIGGFVTGLLLWTFVCPWVDIIVSTRPRGWFRTYRMM